MNVLKKCAIVLVLTSTAWVHAADERSRWELAMAKKEAGDYAGAAQLYAKNLSEDLSLPDKARALYQLGACQVRMGDEAAALKTFRRLLTEHPKTDPYVAKLLRQLAAVIEHLDSRKIRPHVQSSRDAHEAATKSLLRKIRIAEYVVKDVGIDVAVKQLQSALTGVLPNSQFHIEFLRHADSTKEADALLQKKASFDFSDLSVADLIRYISHRYGCLCDVTGNSVVIHPPTVTSRKMVVETYYFDPRALGFDNDLTPEAFVAQFGLSLPMGMDGKPATLEYDQDNCRLTMYNTEANHKIIAQIARMMEYRGVPMLKVEATLVQAELPAAWRELSTAEISGQLLLSLPTSKLEILDEMSLICQSGDEAHGSNKARMKVPGMKEEPLVEQGMTVTAQLDSYGKYINVEFHWYRHIWTQEMLARRKFNRASEADLPTLSKDIRTELVVNDGCSQVIRFGSSAKSTKKTYLVVTATIVNSRGTPADPQRTTQIRKDSDLLRLILSRDWL